MPFQTIREDITRVKVDAIVLNANLFTNNLFKLIKIN